MSTSLQTGLPPAADDTDLLPVRMLNEFVYCPRLFHLMHVEGLFEDNHYTVEGRNAHRRTDAADHPLPDPATPPASTPDHRPSEAQHGDEPPTIARSVTLASAALGLIGKLDLVATHDDLAIPVETKRGRPPDIPERAWPPERIQLMAQGLLLRQHGYRCDHGILYFATSRTRVTVPFTPELEQLTLNAIAAARAATRNTEPPPPLENSPKCPPCSLSPVCLPDETLALQYAPHDPTIPLTLDGQPLRRLYPVKDDATPLYVQHQGARVGISRGTLTVTSPDQQRLTTAHLKDTSQVVLCGNILISPQALHVLADAQIPLIHLSSGHWFYAITHGHGPRNPFNRISQFNAAQNPALRLQLARQLVADKAANQRTLLRRNTDPDAATRKALDDLDHLRDHALPNAQNLEQLLGIEGALAATYFAQFGKLLKPQDLDATTFDFTTRNRRPPKDPVNALLSFGYALLVKDCTVALLAEGLDPYLGLYHQPRHGRPALALDLMEPFRPAIVDSAVLTTINTGMVTQRDFQTSRAGCVLQPDARKAFIRAYEARLDQCITHPVFDYRCSWRAVLQLQARLLARFLRGDIPTYTSVTTR
ncbi:MAG: CRISPR-associated endonuclease Cas1 [Tepidisphaerales bacterium]